MVRLHIWLAVSNESWINELEEYATDAVLAICEYVEVSGSQLTPVKFMYDDRKCMRKRANVLLSDCPKIGFSHLASAKAHLNYQLAIMLAF